MSKKLKESLLWGAAYAALLILLLTPLSIFSLALMPVPIIILFIRQSAKVFMITYAAVFAVLFLLTGRAGMIILAVSVFYLLASLAMARQYKRKASAIASVLTGALVLLAELLLFFLISRIFGINLLSQFTAVLQDSVQTLPMLKESPGTEELIHQWIRLMSQMVPLFLIIFSFGSAILAHALSRQALKRYGHDIPGMKPVKDWMLPRSLVWYYLITLVMDMFIPFTGESFWSIILVNLLPLLTFVFAVQGVSFLFFVADAKGWGYALPVVGIVVAILFSYIVSLIGLIDVAFQIRNRIKNP